jgi:hypothetical protein
MRNTKHRGRLSKRSTARASAGALKKPIVIDRAWKTGRSATCKIKEKCRRPPMPTARESARARERLQSATPICDDASLSKLQENVAEYIREANRRDPLEPHELISIVVDALARNYFRHELRKQAHVTAVRRRTRA